MVVQLRERLNDDLLVVWLYGSRARGEAPSEKLVRELAVELNGDPEELLALAGRVPTEIKELAQGDVEFARFLRRLPGMAESQRRKLYRQANSGHRKS